MNSRQQFRDFARQVDAPGARLFAEGPLRPWSARPKSERYVVVHAIVPSQGASGFWTLTLTSGGFNTWQRRGWINVGPKRATEYGRRFTLTDKGRAHAAKETEALA